MHGSSSPAPTVSVVMAVYNGAGFVERAVHSILAQTFTEFEFIIVDDGSTDGTLKALKSFDDPRIRVLSRAHRGLAPALNDGIAHARGCYIARMDVDDVSYPERLAEQVEFLEQHPRIAIVGAAYEIVTPDGRVLEVYAAPTRDADIRRTMFFETPFGHGTVMVRRDALLEAEGYREESWPAEDYDLWMRLLRRGRGANLPRVLYRYLANPDGICATQQEAQRRCRHEVLAEVHSSLAYVPYGWQQVVEGARHYGRLDAAHGSQLRRRFLRDQYVLSALETRQGARVRVMLNLLTAFVLDPALGGQMAWSGFVMVRQVLRLVDAAGIGRRVPLTTAETSGT